MPAGLIDIVSYGAQDLFLTGTPQITFFKIVYRRHTNFAMESFEIPFDDPTGFNKTSTVLLRPIGDLVHKMYLKVDVPKIAFERTISAPLIARSAHEVHHAITEFQRVLVFMNANTNAYRACAEIYVASNVQWSTEMVDVICKVFASYSTDDVTWFLHNSPLPHVAPSKFNLLRIAQTFKSFEGTGDPLDPVCLPKQDLKLVLDRAMTYSQEIQKYYDQLLSDALRREADLVDRHSKFAWVDRLGHALIDYVDIYIGGERLDRQYGIWINIWYELAGKKHLDEIYRKMIGDVPELTTFDRRPKPSYTLYVPLQFWFNRFNGLALPLVGLQYHEVSLTVRLRRLQECAYIERGRESTNLDNLFENQRLHLDVTLLVDYVYLDSLERKKFAQSSHEYLVDQVQVLQLPDIDQPNLQVRLDFVHSCREMVWVLQKKAYTENRDGSTKCRWDNYSWCTKNRGRSLEYASLDFAGFTRIDRYEGLYFNYVQPYNHHSNTPSDGINVYSFALRPEEHQPTGTCNFSRITKAILNLWIDPRMFVNDNDADADADPDADPRTTLNLWVFAVNINILRIINGMGGIAYL